MTEPDLFVVCKNCSAEVSPYVTECPYCGQRVRKRAPKIGPDGAPQTGRLRRRAPKLPKLRPGEIPGIAPETAPRATQLLIAASLLAMIVSASEEVTYYDLGALIFPIDGDWWRVAATPFLFDNLGYAFIALTATGIFGMHLERRFGFLTPILIFVVGGRRGSRAQQRRGRPPRRRGERRGARVAMRVARRGPLRCARWRRPRERPARRIRDRRPIACAVAGHRGRQHRRRARRGRGRRPGRARSVGHQALTARGRAPVHGRGA